MVVILRKNLTCVEAGMIGSRVVDHHLSWVLYHLGEGDVGRLEPTRRNQQLLCNKTQR